MKKLAIKNFKCFEDTEVEFKNLTILAGANGAGKSTVIQVLLLLKQSYDIHSVSLDNMKYLYLNDYYCELGTVGEVLYAGFEDDTMSFSFYNDDNATRELLCKGQTKGNKLNIIKSIPNEIERSMKTTTSFLYNFDFISADRFGPKNYHHADGNFSEMKVGKFGEYTSIILNKEINNGTFVEALNNTLSFIFGNIEIEPKSIDEANIFMYKIRNTKDTNLGFKTPVNMPYGVSYVLPIIVSCLSRLHKKEVLDETDTIIIEEPESHLHHEVELNSNIGTILIENPEAHLHPSAQSRLGIFLSEMANAGLKIILETHSDHIINGIRIAIKKKTIDNNNVLFNFFEQGEKLGQNTIREINIDKNGNLSEWPKGFFDQYENDLMDLM
ncbi:DUF3696 domain-containing protein [Sulfurospirillum arcachonense]|uniref:DUF3696 domain-containing protein n=1 Tax=Sulfurospirillum arcachonense TaxID=57666 RepID=UPI0004698A61|nr:DUF3696 domain-containing protein [Sulfurospirillum arcachonense]